MPQQVQFGQLWANLAECQKHTKSTVPSTIEVAGSRNSHQRWPLQVPTLHQNFSPVPSISKVIAKSVLIRSFQDHCTPIWVKISHMAHFIHINHLPHHLAIFQFLSRSLSKIKHKKQFLSRPLLLVYLQHNGYRTANILTANVWPAGWRPAMCIQRVERSSHLSPLCIQQQQEHYGLVWL